MNIKDFAIVFTEKFPEIAANMSSSSTDPDLQKTLSQAGTIGSLINIGLMIFGKIKSSLTTPEELAFASFLEVIFETAKESVPSNIAGLSSKAVKSQMDMNEILSLFLKNYTNNYYYLPEHPAKQFKKKIMELMRKDDKIISNPSTEFFSYF